MFEAGIESGRLSQGDLAVIDYVSRHPFEVVNMSSRELAEAAYVSQSIVSRLCTKCGYESFAAMKVALVHELDDEERFSHQDADFPELEGASVAQVLSRVSSLEREAIHKTERLLADVNWEPIMGSLESCGGITLYAFGNSLDACLNFAHAMTRIGFRVSVFDEPSRIREWTSTCPRDELSVFVSYSGMSTPLVYGASTVTHRGLKSIAITSNGQSDLAKKCTWHVPIMSSHMNHAYDRIASYQGTIAQSYALDAIYSIYVSRNYQAIKEALRQSLDRQGVYISRQPNAAPAIEATRNGLPYWATL